MRRRVAGAAASIVLLAGGFAGAALAAHLAAGSHSDLAGRWHLDTASGAERITPDSSGHGSDARVEGRATFVTGRYGLALRFPGCCTNVNATQRTSALEPQRLTVLAWVRSNVQNGTYRYLVAKEAVGCTASYYALYTGAGGGLSFYVFDGKTPHLSPSVPAQAIWDGSWHAVAGTYDGSRVRLYVDGAEVGSGTPAALRIAYPGTRDGPGSLSLGHYPWPCGSSSSTSGHWSGVLDEVRVYSRSLTPEEIAYLHASPGPAPRDLPLPPAPPPASVSPPTIAGAARIGQTLTAGTGSWSGGPTSFAYDWVRCDRAGAACTSIAGATSQTYVVQGADGGTRLRVRVIATNGGGSTAAASEPTALVPPLATAAAPVGAPVSGTVRVKRPGESRFSDLDGAASLPVGTEVNAVAGRVALVAVAGGGATVQGQFWGGRFVIARPQTARALASADAVTPVTNLRLSAPVTCPRRRAAIALPVERNLHARAPRNFRTRGRYASVRPLGRRNSRWLIRDRCRSTSVTVYFGRTQVTDLVRRRSRTVNARRVVTVVVRARS